MNRHPSYRLCRDLAGAAPGGSVCDLAELIACALENAESPPAEQVATEPTLDYARKALARIRKVLIRVELRLEVLR
jgi:hypothetical protein